MKNTAQCTKCNGRKIIRIPSKKFSEHNNNTVGVGFMKLDQRK